MAKHLFDIANTAKDAWGARVCTRQELEMCQASQAVMENCEKAAGVFASWRKDMCDEETRRLKNMIAPLKLNLPVALFHAHFPTGHRVNADAEESNLYTLDIDEVEQPEAIWHEIEPHKDELHVCMVFKSPSGKGLKIVAEKPKNLSIAEAQAWMAGVLGIDDYDVSTKDAARCTYIAPKANNLYYNPERLFGEYEEFTVEVSSTAGQTVSKDERKQSDSKDDAGNELSKNALLAKLMEIPFDATANYCGVPYTKIVAEYWQRMYGKQPQEGGRHQALLDWIREGAAICEFSAERLMAVTPRLDKDAEEVARAIVDTLGWKKRNFRPTMPYTLSKVLTGLGLNADDSASSTSVEAFNAYYLDRMPKLPPALRAAIDGVDRKYHLAVIFGMLPVFCNFAEKVMYKHCDHSVRRPTLFYFCVGPSSSGKDNVTRRYRALTSRQQTEDMKARDENDEVRDGNNTKSADEKGKVENRFVKQRALNITSADLLRWMKLSRKKGNRVEGRLLPRKVLMFDSEAGSVRNAVKDGVMMVNWRKGFDCDRMSADRSTSIATSGDEEVCIDIVAMCTPGVLKSLVSSESQEDGTASRLLISFIPGDPYSDMPIKEEVTDANRKIMHEGLELCRNAEGIFDSPRLRKALMDWNNSVGRTARDAQDLSRAMLRRRACIMGMCAAIVCAILWNKRNDGKLVITKNAIEFGLLTAEYSMETACAVFDDYADNTKMSFNFSAPGSERHGTKNESLYNMLGDCFTRDDVVRAKPGIKNSAISNIIKRYKDLGLIIEIDKMTYKKVSGDG